MDNYIKSLEETIELYKQIIKDKDEYIEKQHETMKEIYFGMLDRNVELARDTSKLWETKE